jgi:hypothetical protein
MQTLRKFSLLPLAFIQTHLAVVQGVKPRITAYLQDYPSLVTAPVCTLCVDTFAVDRTARKTDLAHDSFSYKNYFPFS